MKFLCLHGAFGNTKIFQIQLGAVVQAVEKDGQHAFHWVDGALRGTPPPGYDFYFADPPWHHHIEYLDTGYNMSNLDFPREMAPEDALRFGREQLGLHSRPALEAALARIIRVLDENPDIDGIMGYSEGAMMAASVVLEEQRLARRGGRARHVRGCVFFGGWPPWVRCGAYTHLVLSDMLPDVVVDVPTFHVVGSHDPYVQGGLALYNVCHEDRATLFEHGQAHNIPRDAQTVAELVAGIDELAAEAAALAFDDPGAGGEEEDGVVVVTKDGVVVVRDGGTVVMRESGAVLFEAATDVGPVPVEAA